MITGNEKMDSFRQLKGKKSYGKCVHRVKSMAKPNVPCAQGNVLYLVVMEGCDSLLTFKIGPDHRGISVQIIINSLEMSID